jgi:hypothetical protein
VVACVAVVPPAGAQAPTWQVGSHPSVFSGRYGTETRTSVVYTPVTARRLFADGDLTFVLPMTCIRGNGSVTVVGSQPVRTEIDRAGSADVAGTAEVGRGGRAGEQVAPPRATPDSLRPGTGTISEVVTRCGTGDVVVRGRYYLLDQRGWLPTVAVRAHLKLPTASADRGLGTGRPDEGIGVEITREVAPGLLVMADGGYTAIGQPAGVTFNDTWWYDVGVSRSLTTAVSLSVFFEEYRAIVPGLPSARDVLAVANVTGRAGWRLQVAGVFGLSDGAPDLGLTIGASRRF